MIHEFLSPYIQMFYGAGYNIQQSMEGYGVSSSNFLEFDANGRLAGSHWSPSQAALVPAAFLTLYFALCLIPLITAAGYALNKIKGVVIALLFLSTPGLLNIIGWWPNFNFIPEGFTIDGTGIVGEVLGYVPLLVIALIIGWCLVILIYDSLKLSDKFRNSYDHLWYCSAIVAGIFFIADSEINKHREDLAEKNKVSTQASAYLARQLAEYYQYCIEEKKTDLPSCAWASDAQQKLADYSYNDAVLFSKLGPTNTLDIYFPFSKDGTSEEALRIRKEIMDYNNSRCPVRQLNASTSIHSKPSTICQSVPAQFCSAPPEPSEGIVNEFIIVQTVAVASECIIPTLVRLRKVQEALNGKVESDSRNQHLRWLYFLIFALIAGGKIANASTKLISMDARPKEERRRLIKLLLRSLYALSSAGGHLLRLMSKIIEQAIDKALRLIR